jgi:hypothetical protein
MATEAVMPITAKQALEQWKAGKEIRGFQVEGDPERQREIYAVAFELIGGDYSLTQDLEELRRVVPHGDLTDREFETAHSIAYVAMKVGWAKMVSQHAHKDNPVITISKPK